MAVPVLASDRGTNFKTAGTTSTLATNSLGVTYAVGDYVVVQFAMDPASGAVSFSNGSVGATLGSWTTLGDVANGSGTSGVRSIAALAQVTTSGVLPDITVTHPSATARVLSLLRLTGADGTTPAGTTLTTTGTTAPASSMGNAASADVTFTALVGAQCAGPTAVTWSQSTAGWSLQSGSTPSVTGTSGGGGTSNISAGMASYTDTGLAANTTAPGSSWAVSGTPLLAVVLVPFQFIPASGTTNPVTVTVTAVTTTGTLRRSVGVNRSAAVATAASLARSVGRTVAAASSTAASVTRNVPRALAAAATTAATVSLLKVKTVAVSAAVTTAATLSRQVPRLVAASSATSATVNRAVSKGIQAATSTAASVKRSIAKTLAASSATAVSQSRRVAKTLSASTATTATTKRTITKSIAAAVTTAASVVVGHAQVFAVAVATTVTSTVSVALVYTKAVYGVLKVLVGAVANLIGVNASGSSINVRASRQNAVAITSSQGSLVESSTSTSSDHIAGT